jgi:hypothetical protein
MVGELFIEPTRRVSKGDGYHYLLTLELGPSQQYILNQNILFLTVPNNLLS